jgi:hypothetical protein
LGLRADFRIAGGQPDTEILFLHRRFGDGESYFLSNRKARPEQVEAHFRVTGRVPELWRPETGERTPVSYRIEDGETVVPLTLQPDEAVHVVFRQQTSASSLTVSTPAISELAVLGGPWTVAFQAGRGAPADAVVVQDLAPLDESSDPRLRYFSGVASYRRDFAAPRGWKPGTPLWLDLGEVREIAEVAVNGRTVGSVWHAPYRIDIGAAMRAGKNRLDIRVANLWVNRLIGDARRDPADGSAKISWTAGPTYSASAPLRRSGLIGPVRLLHDRATE